MGHREGRNEAVRLGGAEREAAWMGAGAVDDVAYCRQRECCNGGSGGEPVPWLQGVSLRKIACPVKSYTPVLRASSTRPSAIPSRTLDVCARSSHTHALTRPDRHNHGPDRTQGADRRRAAGASLSVPLATLTRSSRNRLNARLRRRMTRSRSRTCRSRSCSSTAWPQAHPAPHSPRAAPHRK